LPGVVLGQPRSGAPLASPFFGPSFFGKSRSKGEGTPARPHNSKPDANRHKKTTNL
jgi:hypothetical protein